MSALTKDKLKELSSIHGTNAVSIFIPTHVKGMEVNEGHDSILLKNHYQDIKNHIKDAKNIPENEVIEYLEPINKLVQDGMFWRHQSQGLAVFLADDYFEYFKLPYSVDEYSIVGNGFHLMPLIPHFSDDDLYYILNVSLNKVSLLEATQYSVKEVELDDELKKGINEVYKEYDFEKGVMNQSSTQGAGNPGPGTVPKGGGGPNPSGNKGGATWHGHGGSNDNDHLVEEYFRNVEEKLSDYIPNERVPVILVAVERLHPHFRDVNNSFNLFEEGITGNYEDEKPEVLHEKSQSVIRPHQDKMMNRWLEEYRELVGTGKASYSIDDIAPAAIDGRINALFVAKGTEKWGYISREDNSVELHSPRRENDLDLVSKAAVETVLNGGHTYFVEKDHLPEKTDNAEMAAIFRW
jgi:hypothetical protein